MVLCTPAHPQPPTSTLPFPNLNTVGAGGWSSQNSCSGCKEVRHGVETTAAPYDTGQREGGQGVDERGNKQLTQSLIGSPGYDYKEKTFIFSSISDSPNSSPLIKWWSHSPSCSGKNLKKHHRFLSCYSIWYPIYQQIQWAKLPEYIWILPFLPLPL